MNKIDRSSDVNEAQSTYTKATKAEHSGEYDLAYRLYIRSAELYLHLVRNTQGRANEYSTWKASAEKAIQRAEKIKASIEIPNPSSPHAVDPQPANVKILSPVGIDHFSRQEQSYILKRGASINGHVFPPWDDSLVHTATSPYSDRDGQPTLSSQQAKVSPVWRRPSPSSVTSTRQVLPQEIVQQIVADCSVCASIVVCLEHHRRFGSRLARSAVHVLDDIASGLDCSSPILGRYDLKFFFNGTWRRIVVDDALPYDPVTGAAMFMSVVSLKEPPPVWPSILEKGYMKMMGGYEFPGSNSSIDLHAMIGWIPEHLELKGSHFEPEKSWQRIANGFQKGHCILTLGTGESRTTYWQGLKLLPSHSYPVIDMKEEGDARMLTILDTWHSGDGDDHRMREARPHDILWSAVMAVFDGVYVSWDPSRWPQTLIHHGRWRRSRTAEQTTSRQLYLRFKNSDVTSRGEDIWILLARHVTDTSKRAEFMSLKVEVVDDDNNIPTAVERATIAAEGNYTNSSHVLTKIVMPSSQPSGILSIFTAYDGSSIEVGFTVTAYASANFALAWDERVQPHPYMKQIDGVLTSKNSGGNWTNSSFMLNPQYHLQFRPVQELGSVQSKVILTLKTKRDIPVNLTLAWSQGERVFDLTEKDVMATSGPYYYGLARLSLSRRLAACDYTIILSSFEPMQLGEFTLTIESSNPFDVKAVPQEGAGMYTKVIRGAWDSQSAVGGPTTMQYAKNPIFEIDLPSQAQVKIRLQLLSPFPPASLNLTIFPASADGALRRHITTSGAYSDATCGVVTPQVALSPGKYLAVPSTYNPGVKVGFQLYLYSTSQGATIKQRGRTS